MSTEFLARYGEWAVVTGASSGIGREIALRLASLGVKVVVVARSAGALRGLASQIAGQGESRTVVLPMDLSLPGAAQQLQEAVRPYNVGLLVNCAGYGTSGSFLKTDSSVEAAMIDVNCRVLMELTHGFAKRFTEQRRGGIVLLSSIVAFQGVPRAANYAATKAYVQSLGEGLALELEPFGVDVLLSSHGPTHSAFAKRAGMQLGRAESAQGVATDTITALQLRKKFVVPGARSMLLHYSLMTAPRFARVRIMKGIMRSMTPAA